MRPRELVQIKAQPLNNVRTFPMNTLLKSLIFAFLIVVASTVKAAIVNSAAFIGIDGGFISLEEFSQGDIVQVSDSRSFENLDGNTDFPDLLYGEASAMTDGSGAMRGHVFVSSQDSSQFRQTVHGSSVMMWRDNLSGDHGNFVTIQGTADVVTEVGAGRGALGMSMFSSERFDFFELQEYVQGVSLGIPSTQVLHLTGPVPSPGFLATRGFDSFEIDGEHFSGNWSFRVPYDPLNGGYGFSLITELWGEAVPNSSTLVDSRNTIQIVQVLDENDVPIANPQFESGILSVSAVPEPSSFSIFGLLVILGAIRFRFQRTSRSVC